MKRIISKIVTLGAVSLLTLTSSAYAQESKTDSSKDNKSDVIPKITIQAQDKNATKNSKLKEGKACNFDNLKKAEGEEFTEIPMAQTIPCKDVDCKKLKPAVLHDDKYQDLPIEKTIKGCD